MKAPDPTDIQALYGPTAQYKRVGELEPGDILILGRAGENVRLSEICSVFIIGPRVKVNCWDKTVQESSAETWAIVSV